jgi:phosphoribosylanthranilate isomerase
MGAVRIKMCGMTRVEDARRAASLGVDAIGLNFYPSSPRFVSVERAMEISAAIDGQVELFGVFVNEIDERVEWIRKEVGLNRIQFHGDEPPEALTPFGEAAVKVIRFQEPMTEPDWEAYPLVGGFLLEPRHETLFGGSGRSWSYESLAGLQPPRPWYLAGGLSPRNVGRALLASGASAVDVCTGVESVPGIKDTRRMEEFVEEIRRVEETL